MYAIVDIAGQQFKVEKDTKVFAHRLEGKEGSKVTFDKVLLLDDKGKVKCKKCTSSGHLLEMKLRCEEGRHTFKIATVEGYASAISTSSHFVNGGGIAWLQSVLQHL